MARMHSHAALGKNASNSRRDGLCSPAFARERRRSWLGPFLRTRRAVDASLQLIDSCCREFDACDDLAVERPLRATRQLAHITSKLRRVATRLERGAAYLNLTNHRVLLSPAYAADAPAMMIPVMVRWAEAAGKLVALNDRLEESSDALLEYVMAGAPLDLEELFGKDGAFPKLVYIVAPRTSIKVISRENNRVFCLHVRRQRSARITVAEAPRRVFRGRAPPLLSTCLL